MTSDIELRLRELVRAHRVCFETDQDYSAYTGEIQPVGFIVEVYATYDAPPHEPSPGCELCAPVADALTEIVEYALPHTAHPSTRFAVNVRHAISYDVRRHSRPDRSVTIEILHTTGANDPVDDCERECRDEIVGRLKALGVCERAWSTRQ